MAGRGGWPRSRQGWRHDATRHDRTRQDTTRQDTTRGHSPPLPSGIVPLRCLGPGLASFVYPCVSVVFLLFTYLSIYQFFCLFVLLLLAFHTELLAACVRHSGGVLRARRGSHACGPPQEWVRKTAALRFGSAQSTEREKY